MSGCTLSLSSAFPPRSPAPAAAADSTPAEAPTERGHAERTHPTSLKEREGKADKRSKEGQEKEISRRSEVTMPFDNRDRERKKEEHVNGGDLEKDIEHG